MGARGRWPGVLLVQEIFGVGDYMEAVAQDLVALGYVVAAPDMFWRIEPNWTTEHNEEALPKGMSMVSQFDWEKGVEDAAAALGVLKGLPEVGKVGVLGFCFGGTLAYLLAARAEVDSLVSFYGSGVPGMLEHLDAVQAPAQFHFGGDDPYIPRRTSPRWSGPWTDGTAWRSTSRRTAGTRSTTGRRRCSTSRSGGARLEAHGGVPPADAVIAPRTAAARSAPASRRG